MVTIKVDDIYSKIEGKLSDTVKDALYDKLAYSMDGYYFSDAYQSGYWDGQSHLFNKKKQSFLTGLLSYAREVLEKYHVEYHISDLREKPIPNMNLSLVDVAGHGEGGELWEHQKLTIERAISRTRGVFEVSTGGGKTIIVAGIIAALEVRPFVFFVLSKDLMYQAQNELEKTILDNNYGRKIEVGIVGDGKCKIRDINIVMVQSAVQALGEEYQGMGDEYDSKNVNTSEVADHKEEIVGLLHRCKGWYFDECQHLSAPTAQLMAKNSPNAYYRYGGSATPYRDDGADILIEAVTGKKFVAIPASYLIKKGVLMKPKIHIIPINTYEEHIKSDEKEERQSALANNYNSIYSNYIVENEYRNHIISRTAKEFMAQNLSVLVLVKYIKHGDILQDMISEAVFLQGSTPADERQEVIEQLRNKEVMCIIATSLADEGLDVKTLNTIIIGGSGKSSTKAFQRVGRVLRIAPGKKDAIVVDFYDNAPYLRAHSKQRIKLYKSEEEFEIIRH
jgi:superfamily II DNA or RNA helicase